MTVPTRLEHWTFEVVRDLVAQGVFENDRFDFKEMLPNSRKEKDKQHLRKTITSFANTDGGFLVYGVKDGRVPPTEERIVGFDKGYELPRYFGDYPGACEPSVEWEPLNPPVVIPETDRVIHVLWVRPSWRKPHAVLDGVQFVFPKRTNKGNEDMSYTEVRQAFQESDFRRNKLGLLIVELKNIADIAWEVVGRIPQSEYRSLEAWTLRVRYTTMLLDITIGDVFSFLTADKEMWQGLSDIRRAAATSNAQNEVFSHVALLKADGKEPAVVEHNMILRTSADTICDAVKVLVPKLEAMLA